MTTKEKVIRESIARIEKRLKEINELKESRPLQDLFALQKKAMDEFRNNRKKFESEINNYAREEKRLLKLEEKRSIIFTQNWIDEEINLNFELYNLKNELYYIERDETKQIHNRS